MIYFSIKIDKVSRVIDEEKFKCATTEVITT